MNGVRLCTVIEGKRCAWDRAAKQYLLHNKRDKIQIAIYIYIIQPLRGTHTHTETDILYAHKQLTLPYTQS